VHAALRVALLPCLQIILSVAEHHSNLVPWQLVAQKTGAVLKHVRLTDTQELDMQVRCGWWVGESKGKSRGESMEQAGRQAVEAIVAGRQASSRSRQACRRSSSSWLHRSSWLLLWLLLRSIVGC
jgi:hypothetical protein